MSLPDSLYACCCCKINTLTYLYLQWVLDLASPLNVIQFSQSEQDFSFAAQYYAQIPFSLLLSHILESPRYSCNEGKYVGNVNEELNDVIFYANDF
jgi:hypothetical protein